MNVAQSLRSISAYPIPTATLQDIAEGVGLSADMELSQEVRQSKEFRRAQAQTYIWLSEAPNVTQNNVSFSFSEDERKRLRTRGEAILDEIGDEDTVSGVTYGYKGEDL
ncbi:MAG: hypothetical protein HFJ95_01560 [Muribaculaceae bacterium]|nr:hypothetical protein [Muribaculaceae bacterium]